jgi:hypothetical protein
VYRNRVSSRRKMRDVKTAVLTCFDRFRTDQVGTYRSHGYPWHAGTVFCSNHAFNRTSRRGLGHCIRRQERQTQNEHCRGSAHNFPGFIGLRDGLTIVLVGLMILPVPNSVRWTRSCQMDQPLQPGPAEQQQLGCLRIICLLEKGIEANPHHVSADSQPVWLQIFIAIQACKSPHKGAAASGLRASRSCPCLTQPAVKEIAVGR